MLCGTTEPAKIRRCVCAAGHKAFFNANWGGYPDVEFLKTLDPRLERVRKTLPEKVYTVADIAGRLSEVWAVRLGLPVGIPVAVGAVRCTPGRSWFGIAPGTLVKIMGTSTCDLAIVPTSEKIADVPGICGIVEGSVLPGYFGLEAGQSAVGDIFNWFVNVIAPGGTSQADHAKLSEKAAALKPGESGLLALDWHNGNRTVLVDQRLTGLILGLTLHSSPAEIYRALIEATAFGARVIMERYEEYGCPAQRDRQRRRHRSEKSACDADLCRRNGSSTRRYAASRLALWARPLPAQSWQERKRAVLTILPTPFATIASPADRVFGRSRPAVEVYNRALQTLPPFARFVRDIAAQPAAG